MLRPDFIVNLNGFEGPLDLLLSLAKSQKVDLKLCIRESLKVSDSILQILIHTSAHKQLEDQPAIMKNKLVPNERPTLSLKQDFRKEEIDRC